MSAGASEDCLVLEPDANGTVHATCVVIGETGILLVGQSGSGKSDVALRLTAAGATLVADDRVGLTCRANRPRAHAPPALRGLLEVRGVGLMRLPSRRAAPISLVAELSKGHDDSEDRLPAQRWARVMGVRCPLVAIDADAPSAAPRLMALAAAITAGTWPVDGA